MAKYSITMPDNLGRYVDEAMQARKFDNTSEYFRHLVRQDWQNNKADQELRALIDEGLQSGTSEETVESIWANAAAEADA